MTLLNLFDELKERVVEYLDTAYFSNDEKFNKERRKLIKECEDIAIFREPKFEPLKKYTESNLTSDELLNLIEINLPKLNDKILLNAFLESFDPVRVNSLYQHQLGSIITAINEKKNYVVTTGTGSGKSFCFQIPLLINILSESLGTNNRDKWRGQSQSHTTWWNESSKKFEPKRLLTNRTPAIRALIMYPLNALVQDQVDGLRGILNSEAAEKYYNDVLEGDRIYFGQYSGSTPGHGLPESERLSDCRKFLKELQSITSNIRGEPDPKIQTLKGSELITRWDMQEFPPDILITNYSMLSVMLLREAEQSLFAKTKEWLAEDKNNRFYLIIDELHSYRGTGGTEISYIIKSFIHKIGLAPNHPQLQIIATSASLSEKDGQKFLSDFFGTDNQANPFKIINGPTATINSNAIDDIKKIKHIFEEYSTLNSGEDQTQNLISATNKATGKNLETIKQCIDVLGWHDVLLYLSENLIKENPQSDKLTSYPLSMKEIADEVFDGNHSAAAALLEVLITGSDTANKIRMHLFVRNLDGIRRSMAMRDGHLVPPILYDAKKPICRQTGAINLDVYYCQECGELYYCGYKNTAEARSFISNDDATQNTSRPDQMLIHIPREEVLNDFDGWDERWFNGFSGELIFGIKSDWMRIFCKTVAYEPLRQKYEFPNVCINCEADWSRKPKQFVRSPIRSMGTGYNKFSQIIIEQLMGSLRESKNKIKNSKIVIFSDSRRDAALISADLELNHYKDTVRALTEIHLDNYTSSNNDLADLIDKLAAAKENNNWDTIKRHPYSQFDQDGFRDLKDYFEGRLDPQDNKKAYQKALTLIDAAKTPLLRLFGEDASVVQLVQNDLVNTGINPGGLYSEEKYNWQELFTRGVPSTSLDIVHAFNKAKARYTSELASTIREVITSSMGRDFESLGYGWLTFDRHHKLAKDLSSDMISILDSVLRFLIKHYKTRNDYEEGFTEGKLPKYFSDWIKRNCYHIWENDDCDHVSDGIKSILSTLGVIDNYFRIKKEGLFLHPKGNFFWRCQKCRTVHLFDADSRCRNVKYNPDIKKVGCKGQLEKFSITELLNEVNYYRTLSKLGRHNYPLRTEELIGHTDKVDQRSRQLAFQGKFISPAYSDYEDEELEKYFGIEALSVTTTMEAGVDIGGLNAIYMANMPPKRFNYQQRIGRAGRRSDKLSVSITFCKGQKHDEYYFENPILMIGWETPSPTLDICNRRILERILLRQTLHYILMHNTELRETLYESDIDGSVNNGFFGSINAVKNAHSIILDSFDKIKITLSEYIVNITNNLSVIELNKIIELTKSMLDVSIKKIILLTDKYGENYSFTAALGEEGLLPLYGLPIRSVYLIHKDPNIGENQGKWPISNGIIDRNEDIALTEFAPDKSIVKDKKKIRSVGIAWPEKSTERPFYKKKINFSQPAEVKTLVYCTICSAIIATREKECEECGADDTYVKIFQGWRPYAYVADIDSDQFYDGNIEIKPTQILSHPSDIQNNHSPWQESDNFKVRGFQGRLLKMNSNFNRGFTFRHINNTRHMDGIYIENSLINTSLDTQHWITADPQNITNDVALYSELITDVLIATYSVTPSQMCKLGTGDGYKDIAVKAAWDSLAELIGKEISLIEDIEPNEISVGKKYVLQKDLSGSNIGNWAIFITDNLDNGAGYSSNYSTAKNFKDLLVGIQTDLIPFLSQLNHSSTCTTSCYHCLRNYFNRSNHQNLDWRLGLDLANLLLKGENSINFNTNWWEYYLKNLLVKRLESIISKECSIVNTPQGICYLVKNKNFGFLPIHPLVNYGHRDFYNLQREIEEITKIKSVGLLNVFEFERTPISVIQKIMSQIGNY